MPKKRKQPVRRPKSKTTIPKKFYEIIQYEELQLREQKYITRLLELKFCLQYIQEADAAVAHLNKEKFLQNKWNLYANCDPLPKPDAPPKLYTYFTKYIYIEKNDIINSIDWTPLVDERSILSQNITRKDFTRKTLERTIKPEFGYLYAQIIGNFVKIVNRIDNFLTNDRQLAKLKDATLQEITKIRHYVHEAIKQFINRYTYRIICSDEAYMNSLDAISEDYYFSCEYFNIHLWSLKRVPIRFTHLKESRLLVNLHNINLIVHIPYSMLRNDLTIKGLRLNYDHLSEYAKTFDQIIPEGYENISAGIQDIAECLTTEWLMQMTLQKTIRRQLVEAYEDYEVRVKEYQDNVAREKNEADSTRQQASSRPPPIAPPYLEPNEYPDIYEDFLEAEEVQYKSFMENVYSPKNFHLHYHQINLRKYLILGGIYELFYVIKPPHTTLDKINMTWHLNNVNIDENVRVSVQPTSSSIRPSSDRYSGISSKRISSIASERRLSITTNNTSTIQADCPWFCLIFDLPDYLCLWSMPIPCHFEHFEDEVEIREMKSENFESLVNLSKTALKKIPTFSPEIEKNGKPRRSSEIVRQQMEMSNTKLNHMNENVLSIHKRQYRPHSSANYYSPSFFVSRLNMFKKMQYNIFNQKKIDDFYLDDINLERLYILLRHCPEKISTSYKFAKDIHEELAQLEFKHSRSKPGTLRYQKVDDKEPKNFDWFSYDKNQNWPGYIYPHYEERDHISMDNPLEDIPSTLPFKPKTFYQLVSTLLHIKKVMHDNLNHMLEMEPFTSKVTANGKNIKIKETKRPSKTEEVKHISTSRLSYPKRISAVPSSVHNNHHSRAHVSDVHGDKSSLKVALPNTQNISYYHWTTRHMKQINFDREGRKVTIETDRLGYIGFAFNRYEHFPFKFWDLQPSENDPSNEVIFTLVTQHVKCVLNITEYGISGFVTDPIKAYMKNPKMYLVIDKPLSDYSEFKKRFREKNLNIFAERDASFYITNGYFKEKHLASELHTYCCMAVHCTHIHFNLSQWNRLAKRREILLEYIQFNDTYNTTVTALITPDDAKFVQVKELCSDDIDIINLKFISTWRNVDSYCDLHNLICSMYPMATDLRCKKPKLLCYLRDLLSEIRPLSFS